jgi:hypothetical protein
MSGKLSYRLMAAMVALLGYATMASAAAPGVTTAIARELAGFVWAIARQVTVTPG